jgi:hypothetical protein
MAGVRAGKEALLFLENKKQKDFFESGPWLGRA